MVRDGDSGTASVEGTCCYENVSVRTSSLVSSMGISDTDAIFRHVNLGFHRPSRYKY